MITSSVNRVIYKGNGVATEFAYPFKIFDRTDIKVLLVDKDGNRSILTSDYYVDMEAMKVYYPGYAPGAVEPGTEQPAILQEGETLVVYRDVPITQMDRMPENYPFDVNERMHDKSCVIDQQLADELRRSLKFGVEFEGADFDPTLPIQAGFGWRVSDDGKTIVPTENPKIIYEDTVGVYNKAVTDTNAIKEQTNAIKEQTNAVKEQTNAIKNNADAIRAETADIKNETQTIYNAALSDINTVKENAEAAIDNTKNQAIVDVNTTKKQVEVLVETAQDYSDLSHRWADSATSPDGKSTSKSSKTWAEQTASYLDEAVQLRNYAEALAAQVPLYSPTTTYHIGDVVFTADGATYRALDTVTGESPTESFKWAKIQTVDAYTFEKDAKGDIMVRLPATASAQWDVDSSGDVMIKLS